MTPCLEYGDNLTIFVVTTMTVFYWLLFLKVKPVEVLLRELFFE